MKPLSTMGSTLLENPWNVGKGRAKPKGRLKRLKLTPRPRKWRESFTVWIDFIGDRSQIGPLLDHIAGCNSDGGGSFVALPLCDQSWEFVASDTVTAKVAGDRALDVFERLKAACRARWSPYVQLRLLHDDKPDRCQKPFVPVGKNPVKYFPESEGGGHEVTVRRGRGRLVLRKYQRGKCPDLSEILVGRRKRAKSDAQ